MAEEERSHKKSKKKNKKRVPREIAVREKLERQLRDLALQPSATVSNGFNIALDACIDDPPFYDKTFFKYWVDGLSGNARTKQLDNFAENDVASKLVPPEDKGSK
jgi:hypothetical protein